MQTHLDLWIATRWAADLQRAAAVERTAALARTDRRGQPTSAPARRTTIAAGQPVLRP
jgi:hypothetical protein